MFVNREHHGRLSHTGLMSPLVAKEWGAAQVAKPPGSLAFCEKKTRIQCMAARSDRLPAQVCHCAICLRAHEAECAVDVRIGIYGSINKLRSVFSNVVQQLQTQARRDSRLFCNEMENRPVG
jgi:hypothetical protein